MSEETYKPFLSSISNLSKRLNYINHARRLADGDWTGGDSDGEEDMEKQEDGERVQDGNTDEEGMEVERRKLPKHYANQVRVWCIMIHTYYSIQCPFCPAEGALVSIITASVCLVVV